MKLAATLSSFLFLASTAPSSYAVGNDNNLFHRESGKTRGNSGGGITPRIRTRKSNGMKLDPCQKVVDFWTRDRIKSACAKPRHLSLDSPGSPSHGGGRRNLQTVVDSPWVEGGDVVQAAGRLLFQMGGSYSLCSATAVTDGSTANGRSIIVTAAHCVFDDATKEFATNFMFIPNQDDGGSDISDLDCSNDRFGCWTPSFAVVDNDWASQSWSSNIPADYAFLVVEDVGNHRGPSSIPDALDVAVPAMDVSFAPPAIGDLTHGLGYSGNRDPDFRYCVQSLLDFPSRGGYILNGCGLTGGSSGGPWIQTLDGNGRGEVIAVNSYGPTSGPGYMGGPRLHGNSAQCLFEMAKSVPQYRTAGNGIVVLYTGDCASSTFMSGDEFNGRGGGCATCSPYQDAYDQACCNYFGSDKYYASYVSWRGSIYCGRCS